MLQTLIPTITFDEFIDGKPEGNYELRHGVIVEMQQRTGTHENVSSFLSIELSLEIRRLGLPYALPRKALIKINDQDNAFLPDVLLVDQTALAAEPLWKKASTITLGTTVPLAIEVVSTNWRDDYYVKFAAYEEMGIREFWIVDYAGLGGRKFIGNPKQPTVSVCSLVDGEYQVQMFCGGNRLISPLFPDLSLTAEAVFRSAENAG
jgi:Uma2 family endonuclease